MKAKKVVSLLTASVLALSMLAGCSAQPAADSADDAAESAPAAQEESVAQESEVAQEEAPAADGASGQVYYLNFKPERMRTGRMWLRCIPNRPACRLRL